MFKEPFNFDGRISRTEYGISLFIFLIWTQIIENITQSNNSLGILNLLTIPFCWFILAQGVKRCHDVGRAGWWQIIFPIFIFAVAFYPGHKGENYYGPDPKDK